MPSYWRMRKNPSPSIATSVTFCVFWWDKRSAVRGGRRVPEARLHWLELLGGWPGALVAQRVLRHKSAKVSYRVVLWLVVALTPGICEELLFRGFIQSSLRRYGMWPAIGVTALLFQTKITF